MSDSRPLDQMIAEAAVAQREASVQDAMALAGIAAPDDRTLSQANRDGGIPQETILALPGHITATALILPPGLSYAQWEQVGKRLAMVQGAVLWWLGDWWSYGEHAYGEMVSQGAVAFPQYALQTLYDAAWVSGRLESSRRREDLSWAYHREVARLSGEDAAAADRLLALAAPEQGSDQPRMSREELRQAVREIRVKTGDLKEPEEDEAENRQIARAVLEALGADGCTFENFGALVIRKGGKTVKVHASGRPMKVEVE